MSNQPLLTDAELAIRMVAHTEQVCGLIDNLFKQKPVLPTDGNQLLRKCYGILKTEAESRKVHKYIGPYTNSMFTTAALLVTFMDKHFDALEEMLVPCGKCEDGKIEYDEGGGKTSPGFCSCIVGQTLKENYEADQQ